MAWEPGGFADKLGNKYELWQYGVWQLLRLLREQVRSVQFEPAGDDGVDLWVEAHDGTRSAKQCKGRNGDATNWSIADLDQRKVLTNANRVLKSDSQTRFGFVSTLPIQPLRDLCLSAEHSAGDAEQFYRDQIATGSKARQAAFADLCNRLGRDRHAGYDFLRRFDCEYLGDDSLFAETLRALVELTVAGNVSAIIASLEQFTTTRLREKYTAAALRQYLQDHGFQPRQQIGEELLAPTVRKLHDSFRMSISATLPDCGLIPRAETTTVVEALAESEPPLVVMVHGSKDAGKSGVTLELIDRLAESRPVLPIRLHSCELSSSTRRFGECLSLPDSPVACMTELAAEAPAVLVLDQLDVLRWTTSHSPTGIELVRQLILEAAGLRRMGQVVSIVCVCRTFDLRDDEQLHTLFRHLEPDMYLEVEIGLLDIATVTDVLRKQVDDDTRLPPQQMALLRTVGHLVRYLELRADQTDRPQFTTHTELVEQFLKMKYREIARQGVSAAELRDGLDRLLGYVEEHGVHAIPVDLLDVEVTLRTELQSVGLIELVQSRLVFTHQTYLDHLLGRRILKQSRGCSVSE